MFENTPDQIARHYSAAMDSVGVIHRFKAKEVLTVEEAAFLKANRQHLELMLAKDFWTTEDLAPFANAVK